VSRTNRKYTGFMLTEMIVSAAIAGVLLIALALSLNGFARFNRYQLVNQRCIAAARAQLDSVTATGKAIGADDFQRLWPNLTVAVKNSPGAGQWRGMTLTQVTVRGESFTGEVEVRLSRYVGGAATLHANAKQNLPGKKD